MSCPVLVKRYPSFSSSIFCKDVASFGKAISSLHISILLVNFTCLYLDALLAFKFSELFSSSNFKFGFYVNINISNYNISNHLWVFSCFYFQALVELMACCLHTYHTTWKCSSCFHLAWKLPSTSSHLLQYKWSIFSWSCCSHHMLNRFLILLRLEHCPY